MVRECDEDNIIFSLIFIIDAEHIFKKSWDKIHVEAVILIVMLWWSFARDYILNNKIIFLPFIFDGYNMASVFCPKLWYCLFSVQKSNKFSEGKSFVSS